MESQKLQAPDYIRVQRDVPPEALLNGIVACQGVRNYNHFRAQEDRAYIETMRSLAVAQGIRVAAPYPDDSHEVIESAVTQIARRPLGITQELLNEGLITPLPNWWGVPSLRRGRLGQAGRAHRSMIPDSRGERFVLDRDGVSWPIFCTWANFSFDIRELAIGQRVGTPLDVSHSEWATYLVLEANEDQAINGLTDEQGNTMTIDGMSAPGILQSTATWTYATWTGLTGNQILGEIQDAIEALRVTHPGMPFTLFVPSNYSKIITGDYGTAYPKTVLARLQDLGPWGGRNLKVVIVDTLPNDRAVIMAMDRRAVDLIVGQQPVPVSWKDGPGWNTFWVVLDCMIFRMFANKNGEYGVSVGALA